MQKLSPTIFFLTTLLGAASAFATDSNLSPALKPGHVAMIQNSTDSWNDEVVEIVDLFEDGSVRVKRPNGTKAFVKKENVGTTLSLEADCLDSHGSKICKGDKKIYYPLQATSLSIPEATVLHLFANGKVLISDGVPHVFNIDEIGKEISCSPQKDTICEGDYVVARGYRENLPFNFEGVVERNYTNGMAIVKSAYFWRYPVNVSALVKRVATNDEDYTGSVLTSRDVGEKMPMKVTPEVESEKEKDPFIKGEPSTALPESVKVPATK